MYVQFMTNFLLADSSELMAVRLISAIWAQKRLFSTFYTWCTSSSWKIFFSPIPASWWLLDSFRPPEAKNIWFLLSRHDVRRVHEKFSSCRFERAHGCSTHFDLLNEKTFDSYFLHMMYVQFIKNFLSPIPASWYLLDSVRPPEAKNVSFLLSTDDVRRVHEKFSSCRFQRVDGC